MSSPTYAAVAAGDAHPHAATHGRIVGTPSNAELARMRSHIEAVKLAGPKRQLAATYGVLFAGVWILSSCFGYIFLILHKEGSDIDTAARRIQALAFSTAAASLITTPLFGAASDHIGRRSALVWPLAVAAVAALCFGISTHWPWLLFWRLVLGAALGCTAVAKALFLELGTESTRALAFALGMLVVDLAGGLAPMASGFLVAPAERFGGPFFGSTFFEEAPYFLPTAVAALLALVAGVAAWVLLRGPASRKVETAMDVPPLRSLLKPDLLRLLALWAAVGLVFGFAPTVVASAYHEPLARGGLHIDTRYSMVLAAGIDAVAGVVTLPWLGPILIRRFGLVGVLRSTTPAFAASAVALVLANLGARFLGTPGLVIGYALIVVAHVLGRVALLAADVLTADAAPSHALLGTWVGLQQLIGGAHTLVGVVIGVAMQNARVAPWIGAAVVFVLGGLLQALVHHLAVGRPVLNWRADEPGAVAGEED